jgi:hypothetical protein
MLLGDARPIEDIVVNKIKAESGLSVAIRGGPIGLYSLIFKRRNDDANGKAGSVVHDVVTPFIADIVGGKLKLDGQHSKTVWLKALDDDLHPYVRQVLADSGLFPNGKYNKAGARSPVFFLRTIYSEE